MFETAYIGWDFHVWAVAITATLIGGVIRGFTGFGFALILISALLFVADPITIVPLTLILDLLAGLSLFARTFRHVHWTGIQYLLVGSAIGVPAGFACLLLVAPEPMKIAIYFGILASVLLIAKGFRAQIGARQWHAGRDRCGCRFISGSWPPSCVMSGAAGVPGPPVILLYLSSPLPVSTTRATAIAFFIFVDIFALGLAAYNDLISVDILLRCGVLFPLMAVGTSAGHWLYGLARPETVKRAAIILLGLLAIVGIGKVLAG